MKRMDQFLMITTAMLSSSCCIIQLVLNIFSFSCAGFAILTPYRSWLTALTLMVLTANAFRYGLRRTWPSVAITMLIMVSPEMVQWLNATTTHGVLSSAPATTMTVLQLDGLGCIACANRIKHALQGPAWVQAASVFFGNSSAVVYHDTSEKAAAAQALIELVRSVDAKYNAWVL